VLRERGLPRPGGLAEQKAPGDYVTETDFASEHAILEVLARLAPGVAVLGEETGGARAGTMWAVDPLDGTKNFVSGFPVVAVSVGLVDRGRPEVGVVIAPWLGLEFGAAYGRGATLNGAPLPRRTPVDPARAMVATGFPFRRKERIERYLAVFQGALRRFEDLRRAGAAALDLSWTASGSFDGFFELGLGAWDVLAGVTLVRETGGVVTDWEGGNGWLESGDILAAAPGVHEVLLELAGQAAGG
jgi:myo-inositol-1(or 4)-monophosphatase